MAPESAEIREERSYLSSAVDSINPWSTKRSSSPASSKPSGAQERSRAASAVASGDHGDHNITHLYGQSKRTYPSDCPPVKVQWFHAIDVAKRKPRLPTESKAQKASAKQSLQPKKFSAFSISDSKTIESKYQKLLEAAEDHSGQVPAPDSFSSSKHNDVGAGQSNGSSKKLDSGAQGTKVPVNEDFLFDVDIEHRELLPVYWLGPVYEVRRGTWFFQEGSTLRPCDENLAAQLEEGYLKLKPWLAPVRSRSQSGTNKITPQPSEESTKASSDVLASSEKSSLKPPGADPSSQSTQLQPGSHRLFGTYMNNIATYQDANTAWLSTDTMLSWVTSSVYERFSGGGFMSGVKLIRGYSEPSRGRDRDKDKTDASSLAEVPGLDERQQKLLKRRSAPPTTASTKDHEMKEENPTSNVVEDRNATLQRQLSSFIESDGRGSTDTEDQIQQRQEQEMQDYHTQAGEAQGREVDHLILVTHGIGQQLGLRMDSVNFVHDVNVLRKTLKSVYTNSEDLRALNSELGKGHGNSRVQVLPVCWRHLLNFPSQRERRDEQDEQDVGNANEESFAYPSLEDITVEGVAFARSLISDLALDVLLYQSSYRDQISKIVLQECNRIFKLYKGRNPNFAGKVHVMGHSLGSAILFDILCRQPYPKRADAAFNPLRVWSSQNPTETSPKEKESELRFEFDVEDFFCLGSPVGLFQMLEGRTIAARSAENIATADEALDSDLSGDPFLSNPMGFVDADASSSTQGFLPSVSSPKARQLFNIFHPSDPISYRLEPLISPAMATLKPQGLPYTKKGFLNAANQGLTGIGAKVGQSVSGLWSSLSAGIANNMLNRSLGLTSEEVAQMAERQQREATIRAKSPAEKEDVRDPKAGERADERKKELANSAATGEQSRTSGNDVTLIDDELETLYSQFQKKRDRMDPGDGTDDKDPNDPQKARKMRSEEKKVRALNRNGRVDYSIQESVLDFNPINTIASHLSYWSDIDVNHFILSQMLSHRTQKVTQGKGKDKDVM